MQRGAVMLIGSSAGQQEDMILHEFVRLAGDGEAHIAILADAATSPTQVTKPYRTIFTEAGVKSIDTVAISGGGVEQETLQALEQATGIWGCGDEHEPVILGGNRSLAATLYKRYAYGAVIADIAAMAVVLPEAQLATLGALSGARSEGLDLMNGLRLLPVQELYRFRTLAGRRGGFASAVMHTPGALWLDIEPQTAVTIRDGKLAVVGQGAVLLIDVGDENKQEQDILGASGCASLENVTLHMLSNGCGYDLRRRVALEAPLLARTADATLAHAD